MSVWLFIYKIDKRYKIQDILLSFCVYNYTHIRQSIQKHNIHKYPKDYNVYNIHKYTIQAQNLEIV